MFRRAQFRINLYAVAVLSVFVATVLTQLLNPLLSSVSFALFYAATAISAWYGGMKPGLFATILSILSISYFFLPPVHSFAIAEPGNFMRLSLSTFVAFVISYLISELRNAGQQIKRLSDHRLKESKEQLRLAMHAAGMGMWNWNLLTGEIVWSSEHEQLFGLATGTFDGRYETFDARLHSGDREGLNQAVQTAIQEHSMYKYEYRILWADGSAHWIEGRGLAFYDESGKPVRMAGTVMNIDERKRTEAALMQSEQKFRAIFEAEPECVKVITVDGILQNMNPAGLRMLEADNLEQVFGQCVCRLIEPTQQQAFLEFTRKTAQGGSGTFEFEIVGFKGTRRWLESHAAPLLFEDKAAPYILAVTRDITERKRAEAEIRQLNAELEQRVIERTIEWQHSNSLLNSFFYAASLADIGLCIHDLELRFVQINEALAAINGYSVEAHLGKTTKELLPEIASTVNPLLQQVLTTGQPILNLEISANVPSQPGAIRYWLASYFPILKNNSNVEGVGVIVIEITARKQAEVALQVSQTRLAGILDIASDAIISVDANQCITLFNQGAEKIFGYSADEVLGQQLNILLPNRFAAAHYQDVNNFGESVGTARRMGERSEIFARRKDGTEFPAEASISKFDIGDERIFTAFLRDITERRQSEAILRESDRRWRSLLDNVQLIVVGLDQKGEVEYINPFFLQLTDYTAEEVLGKYWFEHFLPQSQKAPVQASFQEILEKEFYPHYQNPIVTKLGEERIIAWSNTLLRNAEGRPIGTISIGEDITERYKLEQMKAEFVSIVSHELRTPLTSISGALELLSTGLIQPASERGQETLQIAATEADRLIRLVNDILDLERLESGKIRLEYQPWDLAELIRRAVDFMQLAANQAGITLSVEPLSVILEIDGDRILQVLTNLLSNAIKFSPKSSTIWLSAEICNAEEEASQGRKHPTSHDSMPPSPYIPHPAPYVLISVRDEGRGIPTNKLETIFERFQQVDASDSRKKGGTGLGLAICRSIVQQHGGNIWAESILDEGSCFHFTLPLTAQH
ncbi:PAS domain S-box protein [Microcoleus sp. T3_B1]|uniref:PAS domain S-box protein n=1 Tax=Microcoleus sp. T3_B1 TaxID=3055425 RepID=UPI002FD49166